VNTRRPIAERRLLQGVDALLPLTEAVELLPGRAAAARAWLMAHVQIRNVAGVQCVRWGDVLDASEPGCATVRDPAPRPQVVRGMRRVKLG
jgi:hypothetical protein